MRNQGGLEGRHREAQGDAEEAERQHQGERPSAQKDDSGRGNRSREQRRPGGRLVIGGEVEDDAAAEGDREPGKEPTGADFRGDPGAHPSRDGKA
jgi:hypothetical protein